MNSVCFAIYFVCILHLVDGQCTKCELLDWNPWNCTDCCKLNAAPFSAHRTRKICCQSGITTLAGCARNCSRSIDEVKQTNSCAAHCTCPNGFHFATTTSTSTPTPTPTPSSSTSSKAYHSSIGGIETTSTTPSSSTSSKAYQSSIGGIETTSTTPTQNGHVSSLHSSEHTSTASLKSSGNRLTVALATTKSSDSQLLTELRSTEPASTTASLRTEQTITTTLGQFQGWPSTAGSSTPAGRQIKRPGNREISAMGFENMCGVGFSLFIFFVGVSVGLLTSVILSRLCKKKGRRIGLSPTKPLHAQKEKRKIDPNDVYKRGNRTTKVDRNAMDF